MKEGGTQILSHISGFERLKNNTTLRYKRHLSAHATTIKVVFVCLAKVIRTLVLLNYALLMV